MADLIPALADEGEEGIVELAKEFGETRIVGQGLLSVPTWAWPKR